MLSPIRILCSEDSRDNLRLAADVINTKWVFYHRYLHTRHIASNFDCDPL